MTGNVFMLVAWLACGIVVLLISGKEVDKIIYGVTWGSLITLLFLNVMYQWW